MLVIVGQLEELRLEATWVTAGAALIVMAPADESSEELMGSVATQIIATVHTPAARNRSEPDCLVDFLALIFTLGITHTFLSFHQGKH